ncbi:hypothetical protein BH11PLA2_BH11PLA2_38990 [soil metagenome]
MSRFIKLPRRLVPRARLALLDLEDRVVPANFVVLSTLDFGNDTLRAAITAANNTPTIADTITFDPTVFGTNQTIVLDSPLPTIATPMTITGPGSSLLTLSKSSNPNPFNMLNITDGNSGNAIAVTVSGIKINGNAASAVAIANETVTLSNMLISGTSFTGNGGAVSLAGGTLTVSNSTISGNSIVGIGGGIAATLANSTIILDHSTIDHNTASQGGGIGFATPNGSLQVTSSTLSNNVTNIAGNTTAPGGGGILFAGNVGTNGFFIRNSTISGNIASTSGGGIDVSNLTGTVTIQNSTIFNNRAFSTSNNAGTGGGGIAVDSVNTTSPDLNVESSIITSNVASNGRNDISTVLSGMTFHLNTSAVGDQGAGTDYITPSGSGNLPAALSTTAALALDTTLAFNSGSSTRTHALGLGSSALNAGSNPANLNVDQNGNPRTLYGGTDIGSVERVNVPTTYAVLNSNDSGSGSLRQAILDANANADAADTIVFEATTFSFPKTITLTSGELPITDSLTITGPGQGLLTISGNTSSRILNLNGIGIQNIAISDMTLTKGKTTGSGGAILDQDENLTLTRMTLSGNRAAVNGGALQLTQGQDTTVTILDSSIKSNFASTTITSDGGGIAVLSPVIGADAYLLLRRSIVAGNSASDDGGGIYLDSNTSLLFESSLLNDNVAGFAAKSSDGGGLAFNGSVGFNGFVIRNSTITGNTVKAISAALSSVSGGGLGLSEVSGTVNILNSTIVANSSGGKSTGTGQGGGGIAITGANSHLALQSSVVAQNSSSNARPDISSLNPVDYDHSAIGARLGFDDGLAVSSNIPFATDLKLAILTGNGGTARTIALRPGSPLIDTGSFGTVSMPPLSSLTSDQRGSGFARQVGTGVDIGAFERVPGIPLAVPTAPTFASITTNSTANNPFLFEITYTSDTPLNLSTIGNNDILVTGPNGFSTLATLVSLEGTGNLTRTAVYSFTPPGGFWNDVDNGEFIFNIQPGSILTNAGDSVFSSSSSSMFCIMPTNFIVTNTDNSGAGSLREAILNSNSNSAGTIDIISFSPEFSSTPQSIALSSSISITDGVNIQGPGANLLTVNGGNANRIFEIDNSDLSQITATISGLTLSNGSTAGDGGAIQFQNEILNLVEVHVTASTAGGNGGGLAASSAGAILNVTRSTLANNKAGSEGGGTFMTGAILGGTATILNSTIAKNTATGGGGGGFAGAFGAGVGITLSLDQSTLTANSSGGSGGGFRLGDNAAAYAHLNSTIASGNNGGGGAADIALASVTSTFTAIGSGAGFTAASKVNDLVYGAALNLGALANNGGPTPSVALGAGSAAINTGTLSSGEVTDQRAAGFARLVNTNLDIGAYEVQPTVTGLIINGGAVQRSRILSIEVFFDVDVTAAVFNLSGAVKLTRTAVPAPATGSVGDVLKSGETAFSSGLITVAQGATNSLLLTFDNTTDNTFAPVPETVFVENTSLSDGYWKLTIGLYNSVTGSLSLRRLYGDTTVNAGGTVNGADLTVFGNVFSSSDVSLDYNNDGTINGADLTEFGNRFSRTL